MKKLFTQFVFVLFLFDTLQAQNFSLISGNSNQVEFKHELAPYISSIVQINGINYQNFGKTHNVLTSEVGAPALPFFSKAVEIPARGNAIHEVYFDSYYDIDNVEIAPSKGDLKRNVNPDTVPYTFGEVYRIDAFYPGELSMMSEPHILRSTRGVTISLYPYQYNPVQKKLRVYENLRVVVKTTNSENGTNELRRINSFNSKTFNDIYDHIYINRLQEPNYEPASETGSMLIITDAVFIDELEPLVEWKNQSGIKTVMVTTAETGNSDSSIKDYVKNYYENNPDLVFLLLAGDSDKVASHTYGTSGWEELWSDSYYGQLEGGNNDYYPELLVGRLSGNEADMVVMVNRILEYEKNPLEGDWMKNAIGVGSNEGQGYGDDGEADFQHLRNIRTQLQDFGYSDVYEFYDGSQGGADASGSPNPTMINNAMNQGVGLFNYTGHGDVNLMVTGNYTSYDANNLRNMGKYPMVISVACNNGTFVNNTTIGEVFMRASYNGSPTGSIAFAGSSILMAWAPPMETQDEMTNILTEVYGNHKSTTLGGLFYNGQMGMLTAYNSSGVAREVMQTWILFGDPSTPFRYDLTQEITAEHPMQIAPNASNFEVNLCNTEEAKVTLSQDGKFLGNAFISDGKAMVLLTESLDSSGAKPILTITKQNHKPYQAEIEMATMGIEDLDLTSIHIYPNPAKHFVNISWNNGHKISKVELRDMTGRVLLNKKIVESSNSYKIDVSTYPRGVYVLTFSVDGNEINKKLVIN